MELFANLNLTWIDGIIVALICLFDEYIIKKLICKSDEKWKAIYTYAPIVLGAIVYIIIALVNKTPWLAGMVKGIGIGLGTMGSYDAIMTIIKTKGVSDIKEIGDEVAKKVETKEG